MKKRVVITGMEITSSIGCGLETFWQAAIRGTCGIKRIQAYDPSPYTTQIAGEITSLSLAHLPEFDKRKRYPRAAQYALFCTHHAIEQAGLTKQELSHAGTYIGTSLGGTPELESAYELFFKDNWKKVPALSVIRGMPNSVANHIAIAFGIGGPNSTVSNACVSSAEAIGQAYQQISQGRLAVAVCGGTESLVWETIMAAWCKLRVMSTQNENPATASKPFDKNRDGMVMADGAGILILEDLQHAKARGAKIYAEVIGFGASCDAYHVTAPHSDGQVRAINMALDDARLSIGDIQYINAHGTGTQLNDITETQTIKNVFGERAYEIPVTAQKAMTGHAIGAAGAMEIIATALSLQHGILLPTINLNDPDPLCDLDYVPNEARRKDVDIALSNHFAFGGANATLILRRTNE
ncbi:MULTISPECIES: beta-ketoacyl-[acyl-carrier-protein] synthase family protein [Legionella]|uniref:Nodulation protein E n=1 Tax=Legionella septentrionalis TaxID=2498109 RepID=A0A433JMB2_9GAMM|nr:MULTISPECIES: beta-ketoacyl-[acyl-carrier-protein] synthase family protein [Legionella]MCP0914754.1 beta-ketoacyl-[acyl-carrier-protein] synthase family protein [Legionella sp. 27cVA30]RUQ91103.1 beta-ketoacyl-[acyl-carrier-protein] synthase family protein [Legionella septentrionalis]RUR02828.1 beta-ketoacyl-[acyl-carrier-protein] synthase family protein [Legionella septentrionalis]RUR11426.1 beta-ketoacyl-[acyl-carrier-protein] synthase family protein [Legionella septentrionalis]RUR15099.1